jgi:hypothetical protein
MARKMAMRIFVRTRRAMMTPSQKITAIACSHVNLFAPTRVKATAALSPMPEASAIGMLA